MPVNQSVRELWPGVREQHPFNIEKAAYPLHCQAIHHAVQRFWEHDVNRDVSLATTQLCNMNVFLYERSELSIYACYGQVIILIGNFPDENGRTHDHFLPNFSGSNDQEPCHSRIESKIRT